MRSLREFSEVAQSLMTPLKCAVIGVGYLGRFHAQKYAQLTAAELVAVCDLNADQAAKVAAELEVQALSDYRELVGRVDAVSISSTTLSHYEIGKFCLENGIHVLIEKPITTTVAEGEHLTQLARENNLVLQVGHLERFNAALLAVQPHLETPYFIESHRIAPFNPRGTDVNVILDLMIHDIDIIQNLVQSPITYIDAVGAPVLSEWTDIANVRLHFASGCRANVTASRISFKTERKLRLFQANAYISIDFHKQEFAVYRKGEGEMLPGIPKIECETSQFEKGDALKLEIKAFLDAIENHTPPAVSGEAGVAALKVATDITQQIRQHLSQQSVVPIPPGMIPETTA